MSTPEMTTLTGIFSEKSKLANAQDSDSKTTVINMSKGLKYSMHKCPSVKAIIRREICSFQEKKEVDSAYFPEMLMVTAMMDGHHGGFSIWTAGP